MKSVKLYDEHEIKNKHKHKFYPTGEKRCKEMGNTKENKNAIYEYKLLCECGATKWVKEK